MRQPTPGEPVNERSLKRSSAIMWSPSSRDMGRIETAPSGRPTESMMPATVSIVSGSRDGGLRTMEQPAAIAGATLWAARLSGKLKGLIPATGPTGKRRVTPSATDMRRRQVQRDGLADHALGLLRRKAEDEGAAVGLGASIPDGLARLAHDRLGDLIAAHQDAGGDGAKRSTPLVGGQAAHGLEALDRGGDGLLQLVRGGEVRDAGEAIRVRGVRDLQTFGRRDPAARKVDRLRLVRGRGRARHVWVARCRHGGSW